MPANPYESDAIDRPARSTTWGRKLGGIHRATIRPRKKSNGSNLVFSDREAWQTRGMARPPRADVAGGLYHVLNLANFGAKMFRQEGDLMAFEKILHEAFRLDKILIGLVESTCLLPFLLIKN